LHQLLEAKLRQIGIFFFFCLNQFGWSQPELKASQKTGPKSSLLRPKLRFLSASMETSSALSLSQLSFSLPKPYRNKAYPSWPCKKPRTTQPTRLYCQKMYVPGGCHTEKYTSLCFFIFFKF
jgi:hypothetical protein